MTENKHPMPENPQDGFDLIEFPCDFAFKAMCRVAEVGTISATEAMRKIVLTHVEQAALKAVNTRQSRTGKFESVTLTVRLQNRSELESIYAAIAESPMVVMTL